MILEKGERNRFAGFDILKFLCAFLIVCIHCPFPGEAGAYFTSLTRIAVPIFLMITGYYYCDTVERGKTVMQIKKILVLVIEANLIFLFWKAFYTIVSGEYLGSFLLDTFTFKNLMKLLLLNVSPFGGHLWYLGAILYVLLNVEVLRITGGGTGRRYCISQLRFS